MLPACSAAALVISATMSETRRTLATISVMVSPACATRREPPSTRSTEAPISALISLAASALRCARLRTSLATTAKPRPCSPARAASTAALSARMLVWNAMESITPVMSPMRRELSEISPMVCTTCATTAPPRTATSAALAASPLAWRDDSALCCTVPVSNSMDEAVCCRLAAVCSVRWLRSWLPRAISSLAVAMLPAACCTWPTRVRSASCMRPMAATRLPISSRWRDCTACDRSPAAMRSASARACSSDCVMERTLNNVSGTSTANPNSTAAAISVDMVAVRWSRAARASSMWPRACVARLASRASVVSMWALKRSAYAPAPAPSSRARSIWSKIGTSPPSYCPTSASALSSAPVNSTLPACTSRTCAMLLRSASNWRLQPSRSACTSTALLKLMMMSFSARRRCPKPVRSSAMSVSVCTCRANSSCSVLRERSSAT